MKSWVSFLLVNNVVKRGQNMKCSLNISCFDHVAFRLNPQFLGSCGASGGMSSSPAALIVIFELFNCCFPDLFFRMYSTDDRHVIASWLDVY